eukprot:TRINITY_DN1843_c0_g1_i2.p1 TRINITY_DN1843_c0_g1~~TRINITY_DN1843_c0_g1_i2.p1  ORF type:complete len:111 (+),score=10.27 TRINITY_DN1843_c0_g1_i2:279-611(+)
MVDMRYKSSLENCKTVLKGISPYYSHGRSLILATHADKVDEYAFAKEDVEFFAELHEIPYLFYNLKDKIELNDLVQKILTIVELNEQHISRVSSSFRKLCEFDTVTKTYN